MGKELNLAFKEAHKALKRSYSPYSKFRVAAVVKTTGSPKLFSGCNIENVSYSLCVCAERVAIFKALSELGKTPLEFLLLTSDSKKPIIPCGACLQVISEFASPSLPIYLADKKGIKKKIQLKDLLKESFTF